MENGNLPNAVMENIESKIDERPKAANENMNQSVINVVTESVNVVNKSVVKHLCEQEGGGWSITGKVSQWLVDIWKS